MSAANAFIILLVAFLVPMKDAAIALDPTLEKTGAVTSGGSEDTHEDHRDHGLVVFEDFPDDPKFIQPDIRPYMSEIIKKHGHEEWKFCVLTSEIHQHLGIYSIVGVKMGLKAIEYFGVGVDELQVISFAGDKPPVSCLNDGIQVSTGATLGHGTISIAETSNAQPEASFTHNGRTVQIRLNPEYLKRIKADISKGIQQHGNQTEAYFDFVRQLAIGYWVEMDRQQIFEIQETD